MRAHFSRLISNKGHYWTLGFGFFLVSIFVLKRLALACSEIPKDWDVYSFLALGRALSSGTLSDILWLEADRPLLIPTLYAIFLKFGMNNYQVAYGVSAAFFFIGAIALFVLFRYRFSPKLSLVGLTAFVSSPLVVHHISSGMTDLPAVCLSIVGMTLLLAQGRSPRAILLVAPIFVMAFLTRFTAGFLLIVLLVYFATSKGELRFGETGRAFLVSLAIAVGIYVPSGVYYYQIVGSFLWPLLLSMETGESVWGSAEVLAKHSAFHPEKYYYLIRGLELISTVPWMGSLIVVAALGGIAIVLFRTLDCSIAKTIGVLFSIVTVYLLLSLGVFIAFTLLLMSALLWRNENEQTRKDLTVLLWFLLMFSLHGDNPVKKDRYFLTVLPQLIYFALLLYQVVWNRVKTLLLDDGRKRFANLATSTLLILAVGLPVAFSLPEASRFDSEERETLLVARNVEATAAFIPRARNVRVASHLFPYHSWFLGRSVSMIPHYPALTPEEARKATTRLIQKKAYDYVFTGIRLDLQGYKQIEIPSVRGIYLYKRISSPAKLLEGVHKAFLIGLGWQDTLERLSGYEVCVFDEMNPPSGLGGYKTGRSLFVDNYSVEQLSEYTVIFLRGFRWHDFSRMESLLRELVASGKTLIIEASGNISSPLSLRNLNHRKLFGVRIKSSYLPLGALISLHDPELIEAFGRSFPLAQRLSGTTYIFPSSASVDMLASLNNKPLVAVQHIGKGKIVWVGFDLFRNGRQQELQKLAEYVVGRVVFGQNSVGKVKR